ncbi:Trm112 family protein [Candidatus Laterigemmans baculatus]|uniref:Trm112 family protein n=1 Tax=Candidatus Laterigemmans baculatus TaxID=2770505 RepID=UPI0013DBF6C4|nr:Trm112 family protein [Candidatus Laterigemmans baculatus]
MTDPPTPLDPALLSLLRCPQTGSELRAATAEEVERTNRRIAAGELRDASGEPVHEPLGGGLVTRCGTWLYPIRDQIPTMIPEEAIPAGEASGE